MLHYQLEYLRIRRNAAFALAGALGLLSLIGLLIGQL